MNTSVSQTVVHHRETPATFYQTFWQDKLDCLGLCFAVDLVYAVMSWLIYSLFGYLQDTLWSEGYICLLSSKGVISSYLFWPAFCTPG